MQLFWSKSDCNCHICNACTVLLHNDYYFRSKGSNRRLYVRIAKCNEGILVPLLSELASLVIANRLSELIS